MPDPFAHPVVALDRLDLRFDPRPWPFAIDRRGEIAAHFAGLCRDNPALWNGRVLVLYRHAIVAGVLSGSYLETDFASFITWRDWDAPDPEIRNCFALAAVLAADGAFLLGVMGQQTANAGRVYFPGGTPEPADVVDGRVDLDGSVRRELSEETGLDTADMRAEPGWTAILAGPRLALIKVFRAREEAAPLRERILRYLAAETQPELADIALVRGIADLGPQMPSYMHAFVRHFWSA